MVRPALELIRGGKTDEVTERRRFLSELYGRYGSSVFGRCRYLLKDAARAEDAMQDVFARALTAPQNFRNESSPLTWLMQISTNHCLNLLRADRALWKEEVRQASAARGEGHGGEGEAETKNLVRKLLALFDEETQAAVIHHHVDGMTLEEVAAMLGRSVPTIRKRLADFATRAGAEVRS